MLQSCIRLLVLLMLLPTIVAEKFPIPCCFNTYVRDDFQEVVEYLCDETLSLVVEVKVVDVLPLMATPIAWY